MPESPREKLAENFRRLRGARGPLTGRAFTPTEIHRTEISLLERGKPVHLATQDDQDLTALVFPNTNRGPLNPGRRRQPITTNIMDSQSNLEYIESSRSQGHTRSILTDKGMTLLKTAIQGRARWLLAFTLLLFAASAVPVLAESPDGHPQEEAVVAIPAEPAPIDHAALVAGLDEAEGDREEREEERAEELESPEAVAERNASRLAYGEHDSAAEVSALLLASFPDELASVDADPARVITDSTLKRDLDGGGAVVSSEGQPQLIEADIPAKVPDEDGELGKVDLDLEATAEGYEPENPILDITIGSSPEEGIAIEGGETVITQVGVDPQSEARLLTDKDVVYPEVQTDTDLVVSPLSSGVEIFNQLRSIESPEIFSFDLDLPEGAQAQIVDGSVEVYQEEKLSSMVLPPHAVDAQGTDIPVAMELEGSTIILSVEHHLGDYAYPILLDPEYVQNDWVNASWYAGNNYHVLEDGTFQTWWNTGNIKTNRWCLYTCWGTGRGLFVSSTNGNFPGNQQGHWTYTPPGETSYLSGYLLNPTKRDNHGCGHSEPHDFDGLWSPYYNIYYQLYTNRASFGNAATYGNTGQTAKVMVFGLNTGNGVNIPCWRDIYAGGVATYMTDPDSPTLDPATGFPTGWIDNSKMYTVNVSAHDKGLGVKNIWLNTKTAVSVPLKQTDCQGTHGSPCYRDMSGSIQFNGNHLDEGATQVKVTAQDALSRPVNSASWWAYTDNLAPEVMLSGQLASVTEEGGSKEPTGQQEVEELSLPVYNLEIKAEDGTHDVSDPRKWRSGVKAIKIYLDGSQTPLQEWTQSCPGDSCSLSKTYTLKLHELSSGEHKLKVIATDQLNHPRERVIEFEYVPATGMKDEYMMHYFPLPDGQGNEAEEEHPDRPELAVNLMNGNLVYREKDVEVQGPAVSLEVERYYNSLLPENENTEWGDGWTLAQTPELDPTEGPGAPEEAELLDASGALEEEIELPTTVGGKEFDPSLQATITKEAGGGYELADESGEAPGAIVFDEQGQAEALRAQGYAKVDYGYAGGDLSEIAVKDPGSASNPSEAEEAVFEYVPPAPTYKSTFGSLGTGNGQFVTPTDAAMAANGDIWVVDRGYNRVQRFSESGTYISKFGSTGTGNGQFKEPTAIAIDPSGNLWIADMNNSRIQKFNSNGEFIKTVGSNGTGNGQFKGPEGIAADSKGNVYVADSWNQRIQKFNSNGEFLAKFGSYGNGNGQFWRVNSVDVGPGGKIWVTDSELQRVTQFNEAGEFVQKFGAGGSGAGQFNQPGGIEVDSRGNVWVVDIANGRVQQFSQAGTFLTQFGAKGWGAGQFTFQSGMGPHVGITVDSKGGLWVTDSQNGRIQKWGVPNYRPSYQSSFGSSGTGDGQLKSPGDVAVDDQGNLWIVDRANNRIQQFDQTGKFIAKFGSLGSSNGQFNRPTSIAIDASGNLWVADANNNRIQTFDGTGQFIATYGTSGSGNGQFSGPEGIAADSKGNIYVADTYNRRVQVLNEAGEFVQKFGTYGTGPGQFGEANALDIGPKGEVWVADWANNRVSQFNEKGEFVSMFGSAGAGDGQFSHPDAVEVDTKGNIWVGDQSNNRVQLFSKAGEYVTQFGSAGTGAGQFSFTYPMGIAADTDGDLWVTDVNNHRIQRWVMANTNPTLPPEENDPSLEVDVSEGLVSAIEGEEADAHSYAHSGDLLTAHDGPEGETTYVYDSAGRMIKVTLPNGTYAEIAYNTTYGRVGKVTVDPAGTPGAKSTFFTYQDSPSRRTTVTPPGAPVVTYDIGDDGSVLKWQNAVEPPELSLAGSIAPPEGEKSTPIWVGLHNLVMTAHSEEGVESIQLVANGNQVIDEKLCEKEDYETPEIECKTEINEWVMETEDFAPGILNLEVVVEDRLAQIVGRRFWVNIPAPSLPPSEGAPRKPKFKDILRFREEFGLEVVDPVSDETELNDRIFELINAWMEGNATARATMERWGVPLRTKDVEELEYRERYLAQNGPILDQWGRSQAPNTYAGYFMDHRAGGKLRIGFTSNQGTQVESAKELEGLIAVDRIAPFTSVPAYPLGNLEALETDVATVVTAQPTLFTRGRLDVAGNLLEIGATNPSSAASFLESQVGPNDAISVYYDSEPQTPRNVRERASGRMRAGDSIYWINLGAKTPAEEEGWECTAGFGAWEQVGDGSNGQAKFAHFLLTAAHCEPGLKVFRFEKKTKEGIEDIAIGKRVRSGWNQTVAGYSTDGEAIRLDDPDLVPRWIQLDGSSAQRIRGTATVPSIGTILCHSGISSLRTRCGAVKGPPEFVQYDGHMMYQISIGEGSISGDSGGPVWKLVTGEPVGLLSSGPEGPAEGTEAAITPLLSLPEVEGGKAPGILAAPDMGNLALVGD